MTEEKKKFKSPEKEKLRRGRSGKTLTSISDGFLSYIPNPIYDQEGNDKL